LGAKLRVIVTGSTGKIGQLLINLLDSEPYKSQFQLTKALSREDNLEEFISKCDVVIDFSHHSIVGSYAEICKNHGKLFVSGTTGLNESIFEKLSDIAKFIPVFYSPNMCKSTHVFANTVASIAKQLRDFDVEIVEMHHNMKIDAPSGTALMIGKEIAKSRGIEFKAVTDRNGLVREKDSIGFASIRAGNIVGEHTVYLISGSERIEFKHIISDRAAFAKGSLDAALWLANKAPGKLYSISDLINS